MKVWTAHFRPKAEPVLIRDGFSWGALFLGPIWLLAHRAWVPAALSLAAFVLIWALFPEPAGSVVLIALAWLHGLSGWDLQRWSMAHRGFAERHVLVGRSEAEALDRLLSARPDLATRFAAAVP